MKIENFSQDFLAKLHRFREDHILCDTVLTTDDCELWVHSVVLAAASPQICASFSQLNINTSRVCYSVRLVGCDTLAVELVLHYLYTGTVVMPGSFQNPIQLAGILTVCNLLGINAAMMDGATVSFQLDDGFSDTVMCSTKDQASYQVILENLGAMSLPGSNILPVEYAEVDLPLTIFCTPSEAQVFNDTHDDDYLPVQMCSTENKSLYSFDTILPIYDNQEVLEPTFAEGQLQQSEYSSAQQFNNAVTDTIENTNESLSGSDVCNFMCDKCGKQFASSMKLKEHRGNTHHAGAPFTCKICGKVYNHSRYLRIHLMTHSGRKPFLCDLCGRGFYVSTNLKHHTLKYHTDIRPWKCEVCGKGYVTRTRLVQHAVVHAIDGGAHSCETCGSSFTNLGNLARHRMLHTGCKPYKCPVCEREFSQKVTMQNHVYIHSATKVVFTCPICDKRLRRPSNLRAHMRVHTTQQEQHLCTVCNKKFLVKEYLTRHILTHDDKSHVCPDCGKSFRCARFLVAHAKSRTANACKICGQSFCGLRATNSHMKSHAVDSRLHVCETCGESFAQGKQLKIHMKFHSTMLPVLADVDFSLDIKS